MELTWSARAEFRARIIIAEASRACPATVSAQQLGFECDDLSISLDARPGTYWFVIFPWAFTDTSLCGTRYTATVDAAPLADADINDDGVVDGIDLGIPLSNWTL